MSEKVEIPNIKSVGIGRLQIGQIDIRSPQIQRMPDWAQSAPQAIPINPPVTSVVGTPIVNVPGCVEAHRDSSENQNLKNEDEEGTLTYCDAGTPSFTPIDYDRNKLDIKQGAPVPPVVPPSKPPEQKTPETPGIPQRPSCKEGEKYNEAKRVCEKVIIEVPAEPEVPWTQKYLPSPAAVTTTASIAVVATTSALLAKPLADLLLKVVKPATKKIVKKIAAIRKKKIPVLSLSARRDEQRERNRAIRTLKSALRQRKR